MRKLASLTTLLLSSVFVAAPVFAEEGDDAEIVVVTATKSPTPLREIGSTVSVIEAESYRDKGAFFLNEALLTAPGVGGTQTGGPGQTSVIRLRGEEGYRTLVVVDGLKVSDPAGPQVLTDFGPLTLAEVDRIEIVRGPQSLLYGADAIGGVVNIITRRGRAGFHVDAAFEGGSFGTAAGWLSLSGAEGAFDFAATASGYSTDGFTANEGPGFVEDDGYDNFTFHGVAGAKLGPDTRLEAVLRHVDAGAQFDSFGDNDNVLYLEQTSGRVTAMFPLFSGHLQNTAAVSFVSQNRADYAGGAPNVFGSQFDGERTRVEYTGVLTLNDDNDLIFGIDHENEDVTTDALSRSRDITGVYGEWTGGLAENLFVTAGIRFDEHSQFGDHISWRATIAWLPAIFDDGETKFHASVGTGFRAPSLFELFDGFSGDPTLVEESSIGFDVGVDRTFWQGRGFVSVVYFDQRMEDEIRFDPNIFVYLQNAGSGTSRGIETSLALDLGDGFGLHGAYTYTETEIDSNDLEDGMVRLRRPKHMFSAGIDYHFWEDRARIALDVRGAAEAEDGFYIFRSKLDDYAVVDLAASVDITENASVFVRGVNIFDEQYQPATGYAAADAAAYAGIRVRY